MKTSMLKKLFLVYLHAVAFGIQLTHAQSEEVIKYVGAVLEFAPYDTLTDEGTGLEIITINANSIVAYAEQAKLQFADIFVAPEYGIQSLTMKQPDDEKFLPFTQYVPHPSEEITPCNLPNDTSRVDAMRILSCAADAFNMYMVIDLAELSPCNNTIFDTEIVYWQPDTYESCVPGGYYAYNTQVVFDREGKIIARYRKQHLFLEENFTPGPKENSESVFVTDFGVTFSLQVCFDIVYTSPGYGNVKYGGVRDVIMSTAWVDELPFHLANVVQNGFSRGLETNLLVSAYHNPFKSKMGSGIYRGYTKEMPNYVYDKDSINVLLISTLTTRPLPIAYDIGGVIGPRVTSPIKVPETVQSKIVYEGSGTTSIEHTMLQLDMSGFTTIILDSVQENEIGQAYSCSNNFFCCNLTYQYSGSLSYGFTVFSGQFTEGGGTYLLGLQLCGIVYCQNGTDVSTCGHLERTLPESDTFGPFELSTSSFSAVDVYPMGLQRDLTLVSNDDLMFYSSTSNYRLYTDRAVNDLLSTALYGRWYANDP